MSSQFFSLLVQDKNKLYCTGNCYVDSPFPTTQEPRLIRNLNYTISRLAQKCFFCLKIFHIMSEIISYSVWQYSIFPVWPVSYVPWKTCQIIVRSVAISMYQMARRVPVCCWRTDKVRCPPWWHATKTANRDPVSWLFSRRETLQIRPDRSTKRGTIVKCIQRTAKMSIEARTHFVFTKKVIWIIIESTSVVTTLM